MIEMPGDRSSHPITKAEAFKSSHLEKRGRLGQKTAVLLSSTMVVNPFAGFALGALYAIGKKIHSLVIDYILLPSRSQKTGVYDKLSVFFKRRPKTMDQEFEETRKGLIDKSIETAKNNKSFKKRTFLDPIEGNKKLLFFKDGHTKENLEHLQSSFEELQGLFPGKIFSFDEFLGKIKDAYLEQLMSNEKVVSGPKLSVEFREFYKMMSDKSPHELLLDTRVYDPENFNSFISLSYAFDSIIKELRDIVNSEVDKTTPSIEQYTAREVDITTHDGAKLNGFVIPNKRQVGKPPNQQKWMICFLPNLARYEDESMIYQLKSMSEAIGCNILTFNYRGTGKSQDRPENSLQPNLIEEDLIADGEAAVEYLTNQGIKLNNILLHGHSQGGAIATQVAALHQGEEEHIHLCVNRSFTNYKDATIGIVQVITTHFFHALSFLFPTATQTSQIPFSHFGNKLGLVLGKIAAWLTSFTWEFDSLKVLKEGNLKGRVMIIDHPDDAIINEAARFKKHIKRDRGHRPHRLGNQKIRYLQMEKIPETAESWKEQRGIYLIPPKGARAHNMTTIPLITPSKGQPKSAFTQNFVEVIREVLDIE